jgi:methyl-accepting chemotaxis protein
MTMLGNLGIGKRLGLAFGLIVALMVLSTGIAYQGFHSLEASLAELRDNSEQIFLAKEVQTRALNVMTYVGAMAAAQDAGVQQTYLARIAAEREAYKKDLEILKGKASTSEMKMLVGAAEDAVAGSRETNNRVVDLAKAGKQGDAVKLYATDSVPRLTLWADAFDGLNQRRRAISDASMKLASARIRNSMIELVVAGLVAILCAGALGWIITRSIVAPVQGFLAVLKNLAEGDLTQEAHVDSRDEIGHLGQSLNQALRNMREAMREVGGASMAVSSGATELSASAEQMSTTTQEIAKSGELLHGATDSVAAATLQFLASVEHVAGNVKTSVSHAEQAVQATEAGAEGSRTATEGMLRIKDVTAKISSAVAVIREIAQQTNLLSLNAAIEAAKAGEQGKGFSVVAEEVRKLAERSRQATVEIEKLIQETHQAVEDGAATVGGTLELMSRIQKSITNVSGLIREIGSATQEQSSTASEIARRMEESSREVGQNAVATQELSATVQEISRTAADLAQVSSSLAGAVARFKV